MRELVESPVFLLALTLVTYQLGRRVRDLTGAHALAQPVLVAVVLTGGTIVALDVDAATYAEGVQVISFWLGAATVALAVPLHRQVSRLRGFVVPMLVAIPVGAVVSVVSVVLLARWTGADEVLARTLSPKAATTPVSIALSETVGGVPSLTAALTIAVGILGAVAGPAVLTLARVTDRRARGLALGAVSHGIGASRALAEDETEGAFAGLAMGLSALATSLLLPLLLPLLL
ncbi:LrgB family protein [Nocardioides sp. Arc9.136]|uniref:LrgB family protein n=1 Tax=Nocardioides sp. Arc9.136 TaxID=2996826 RepID=UPI00266560CB|nr:LrgB family protein [Nocardioides sp. Arc9.136]WKN49158.1 LrgB family protein [Nocardioides sp. Arc9.136]